MFKLCNLKLLAISNECLRTATKVRYGVAFLRSDNITKYSCQFIGQLGNKHLKYGNTVCVKKLQPKSTILRGDLCSAMRRRNAE